MRIPACPLLLILPACLAAAEWGDLADLRQVRFQGGPFSPEALRAGLLADPTTLLGLHPRAERQAAIAALVAGLDHGLRAHGHDQTGIEVAWVDGVPLVTLRPGPRWRCGELRITGGDAALREGLRSGLAVPAADRPAL